jgi:hypothetical protein
VWSRCNPRLRLRGSHPPVGMVVPLAVQGSEVMMLTGTLEGVKRLKRTVEVVRQTCRNMWRRWCLEFVSRAVERCLMP